MKHSLGVLFIFFIKQKVVFNIELFKLFGSIFLEDKGVDKRLNNIDNKAGKLGGTFSELGKVAGVLGGVLAGVGGAVGGWKFFVESNAQMEQYKNTLGIVLKDTTKAAETLDWATKFAAKTPFEIPDIVDATVKLTSYGIKAQDVLGTVGDMASAMGKPLNQAIEAIADVQTGELERLKEFGITKKMLIEQAAKMGMNEIVNAKGQITDMEGMNKALMTLMQDRYKGSMDIQSTSLNGMISNLKDWFASTGRILGEGIFDKIKDKLGQVLTYLNDFSKSGKLEQWAKNTSEALTTFWNVAEGIFNGIFTAGSFIYKNWNLISPVLAGVLAGFMAYETITAIIQAVTLAQTALNAVMVMNPIGLVVLAIGALVTAGVLLYKNWDTVTQFLSEKWTWIKQTGINVFNSLKDFFIEWGPLVLAIISGPIGLLVLAIVKNWTTIKTKTISIFTDVKNSLLGIWNDIVSGIKGSINLIIRAMNGMIRGMNKISFSVPDWVPEIRGKEWGINIPQIPMLAKGTTNFGGGMAIVGEQGPELVNLPKGSDVIPNNKLNNLGSNVFNFNFSGPISVRNDNDIKRISTELFDMSQNALRGAGVRG